MLFVASVDVALAIVPPVRMHEEQVDSLSPSDAMGWKRRRAAAMEICFDRWEIGNVQRSLQKMEWAAYKQTMGHLMLYWALLIGPCP